ncbi:hypothetical protein GOP47_0018787 [Adiantum capillus-veneris]|uniref:BTB domain-containing protein n=1 Tax=Adiantum capillus-veneris TaxID=13818 RepID=A0A9D4UDU5_ADICA|nr:hypothetical protein GOP47_0018787 [Adiantum capillus-veneris]
MLKLTIKQHGAPDEGDGPAHDCASLDEHGWSSLIQQCIDEDLSSIAFLVSRDLLQQKSSFFRSLLGGDFRESVENHVSIAWDPATFCCLLECLYSEKLHIPCDMECFLEGILFFGVETAMISLTERIGERELVKWAPKLWNLAKGLGQYSVAEACIKAFAINFEDEVKKSNFANLAFQFLVACMEHKQLTITSELFLCEAILKWISCKQKMEACSIKMLPLCNVPLSKNYNIKHSGDNSLGYQEDYFIDSDETISNIFHKVKILLLPLDYITGILYGSLPASMFRVKATELTAYEKLFCLHEEIDGKTIRQLQAAHGNDLTLRITKHTKTLDLSGCHQITAAVLFLSLMQLGSKHGISDLKLYSKLEAEVLKIVRGEMITSNSFDQDLCKKLMVESLFEVNLQRCWRLNQSALASWLCVGCPNLKLLDISHCPQLDFSILSQISLSCKSLEKVKMQLYFNRFFVKSKILQDGVSCANHSLSRDMDSIPLCGCLPSLTSLSLEGRSSLKDSHLDLLARCCINLTAINLGGCFELTDRGLAKFLARFKSLTMLEVAYTAFGELSVNALLCEAVAVPSQPSENLCSLEMRHDASIGNCILTALNLEGCSRVNNISISRLLKKTPFLKYLNLGYMRVDDSTLLSFGGTLLKKLNLRETEVTECSVAHILKWNQQLENLSVQGCKSISVSSALETAVAAHEDCASNMLKGSSLKHLALGWGFTDSVLKAWKSSLWCLQSLSLGLGGRISEGLLNTLFASSPHLEDLSLTFQMVSDTSLVSLLKNLPMLWSLELHHCLGDVSREIICSMPTTLTKLCLERGFAWMTDGDIELLSSSCKALTNVAFTGCPLLTPKSLRMMCKNWQGVTNFVLKECGTMTLDGGCCLFVCKALQQLTLRHSGPGLSKDFAECAHVELCLDICDSKDGGFNSIKADKKRSLVLLRFTRCTTLRNGFMGFTRQHYKDSVFIQWLDNQERSVVINEGL